MTFLPTPKFVITETLKPGYVFVLNDGGDPVPEALQDRLTARGGIPGIVLYEGQQDACWSFVDQPAEHGYETTHYQLEQLVNTFEEERGESLCSLVGGEDADEDLNSYMNWYVGELNRRKGILDALEKLVTKNCATYEHIRTLRRALYRAANRHLLVTFWQAYSQEHVQQLLFEWQQEREQEHVYADRAFEERKAASGMHIGSRVKTCAVPRGARTIPVPLGTIGEITETSDIYWWVSFPLPLTDATGDTWLPFEEKTTLTVGYLTDELEEV